MRKYLFKQYTVYYYLFNFIALFSLCYFNVGYKQYQSHALINYDMYNCKLYSILLILF